MKKFLIIFKYEYISSLNNKSFWFQTLLIPIFTGAFIWLISNSNQDYSIPQEAFEGQISNYSSFANDIGNVCGAILTVFLILYSSQIYAKVKKEKTNRLMEILASSVNSTKLMEAKILSVGAIGLTQIAIWIMMTIGYIVIFASPSAFDQYIYCNDVALPLLLFMLFFIGGFLFYGGLFAACGAMTDRDNENQGYMSALSFVMLMSFNITQFADIQSTPLLTLIGSYVPFSSPAIGCKLATSGTQPLPVTIIQIIVLYGFAILSLLLSGKIYKSTILLRGVKLSPKDLLVLIKAK